MSKHLGTHLLQDPVIYPITGQLRDVCAADFDENGTVDLAFAFAADSVLLAPGLGNTQFGTTSQFTVGSKPNRSRPRTSTRTGTRTWRRRIARRTP